MTASSEKKNQVMFVTAIGNNRKASSQAQKRDKATYLP